MGSDGLFQPQFQNEDLAFAHVEAVRWPNGPVCPHCESENQAYKIAGKPGSKNPARRGLYKCKVCKKQFTVLVNSIFSDSHIPLRKWLLAIRLMCSSKKGMSAHQLWRNLWGEHEDGTTKGSYRSAWFMCHRIRWAMTQEPISGMLSGSVEVDECYIGGREKGKRGLPGKDSKKTPVVSFVKRGGGVRSFKIERVTLKNIKPLLQQHVDKTAELNTDDSSIYYMVKPEFPKHASVNHSKEEYVRREADGRVVTTNTVEGYFSLVKRGVYGVYHHWSREHLQRYLSEFDFRYNARHVSDSERALIALRSTAGKRLTLTEPKAAIKDQGTQEPF